MKLLKDTTPVNKQQDEALENTFSASDSVAMPSSFHAPSVDPAPFHEKETSPQLMRFVFKVTLIFLLMIAVLSFIFKAF